MRHQFGALTGQTRNGSGQSALLAGALLALALPGVAPANLPAASTSVPAPASRVTMDDPEQIDWMEELEWILAMLCALIDCYQTQHALTPATDVQNFILAYEANGVSTNLTPAQITQGISDTVLALAHAESDPGVLNPDLRARYIQALNNIHDDLVAMQ